MVQQSDVNFKPKELYLDYGKLPSGLIWRTPKEGDFIVKFGGQTRKLKQYLTDKKIGAIDRKSLPSCGKRGCGKPSASLRRACN